MYYCVIVALSLILYFWYQDDAGVSGVSGSYREFKWPLFDWFIGHFILVILQIVFCFLLQKKVGRSYLKTYRWLRPNRKMSKENPGKYRTIIEVQAPSAVNLRL